MKLISVEYIANQANGSTDWELKGLLLDDFNLIVGKNATGKTLTLKVIEEFSLLIDKRTFVSYNNQALRTYRFSWMNERKDIIDYEVVVSNGKDIVSENLVINGKTKLDRTTTSCHLFSEKTQQNNAISPPKETLTIHVRRDNEEYPFFEEIIAWAAHFKTYGFTNVVPLSNYRVSNSVPMHPTIIIKVFIEKYGNKFVKDFIKDFNRIGFNIKDITSEKFTNGTLTFNIIEDGISKAINENILSEGMFRAFSLLAYIYYLLDTNTPSTVLIDDLAEGLDYTRATNLAQLLLEKSKDSPIQLIATTNDSHLMDAIPTHHWNILKREGNVVKSYNYKNCKDIFDDFDFTGLNNFYLFTSDYLGKALWKKAK